MYDGVDNSPVPSCDIELVNNKPELVDDECCTYGPVFEDYTHVRQQTEDIYNCAAH